MSELSVDEIRNILRACEYEQFIGAIETQVFECKSAPYFLENIRQKRELAKDVSGLANADGGFILVGLHTEANPTRAEEAVTELRPFGRERFDIQQYIDVLKRWLHPAIERMEIEWLPSADDPKKGIGFLFVPPQPGERGPFLITRTVDEDDKLTEIVFGYVERRRTSVDAFSAQRLHALIQSGAYFSRFGTRL